jgi:hypothetical protein
MKRRLGKCSKHQVEIPLGDSVHGTWSFSFEVLQKLSHMIGIKERPSGGIPSRVYRRSITFYSDWRFPVILEEVQEKVTYSCHR